MKGRLRYAVCVSAAALVLVWCFPSVGQVIRGSMSMTVADSQCAVEITAKGFKTAVQDNISVGAGQASGLGTIEMSLALKNSSGKLARGS